jgi:hypothetical protein
MGSRVSARTVEREQSTTATAAPSAMMDGMDADSPDPAPAAAGWTLAELRERCADTEAAIVRLTDQLAGRDTGLPPPGTSVQGALVAEIERVRRWPVPVPVTGHAGAGFEAARDTFVQCLHDHAVVLPLPVACRLRPYPAHVERLRHATWTARFGRRSPDDRTHSDVLRLELDGLQTALDTLNRVMTEARSQLAAPAARPTAADAHWRGAVARELRTCAEQAPPRRYGTIGAFAVGYNLAADSLARHLRERADEFCVSRETRRG